MAKEPLTIEAINAAVTPLERKYGWGTEEVGEGKFELFVTDDNFEARGPVESLESLDELVKELEKQVDEHEYAQIG